MICVSIQGKTLGQIEEILGKGNVEMAEIRLDLCPALSEDDVETLFSSFDLPLIATCRIANLIASAARGDTCRTPESVNPQKANPQSVNSQTVSFESVSSEAFHQAAKRAEKLLTTAVEAGAAFVDLEVEAPAPMGKRLRRKAYECGSTLIRSYHDFRCTADLSELLDELDRCRMYGADIVKIVTTAHSAGDAERVMSLYGSEAVRNAGAGRKAWEPEGRLVAFCMGEYGRASRLECLRRGSPFTYAALCEEECTAPGQWSVTDMSEALYGELKRWDCPEVRMPASKSFAQRAIIAAALAEGTSHLRGYSSCADSEAAISVARALGAEVDEGSTLTVRGIGPARELRLKELSTGESGLLTRLMIPVLARLNTEALVIKGEKTLLGRPLSGANDIMAAFGVMLSSLEPHSSKEVFVPLRIQGRLLPGRADISGKGGSQLISGLLMALPLADKPSTIYVDEPKSIPYMFITVDVLKRFGIRMSNEMEGGQDFLDSQDWSLCTGMNFKIKGGQKYCAADFDIEGDWSSAAVFLAAGAIFGSAQVAGLDTHSLQADLSIMDILVEAGAGISQIEAESVESVSKAAAEAGAAMSQGVINVAKAPLGSFNVDLNNAPDLFPVVSVLAAFCAGMSRIAGVGRLAGKESDRAAAIKQMLTQMGVGCTVEGDELVVEGHGLSWRCANRQLIRGGSYSSYHDHRMVMALKLASLGAESPVIIDDEACVSKSFPDFLEKFSAP